MSKIFVIAGNKDQAELWIRGNLQKRHAAGETTLSRSEYIYVADSIAFRGYSDPHGVFVGTWRERHDIALIVEALFLQCIHINRTLERIRDEVVAKKPTPKLKPVAGGWINTTMAVQIAAQELAKEIDNHIVQELSK